MLAGGVDDHQPAVVGNAGRLTLQGFAAGQLDPHPPPERGGVGAVDQVRPSRPRPAVWWSATTTSPSPAPARAASTASVLVDPISSKNRTVAKRVPASRLGSTSQARGSGGIPP